MIRAMIESHRYESKKGFKKWSMKMPYFKMKDDWEIRVAPPFGGAVARFSIKGLNKEASIYFDVDDSLACVGEPYWELMFTNADDVERFLFDEFDSLYKRLCEEL